MHLTQELLIEKVQAYVKIKQICNIIEYISNPGLNHTLTVGHSAVV